MGTVGLGIGCVVTTFTLLKLINYSGGFRRFRASKKKDPTTIRLSAIISRTLPKRVGLA